MEVGDFYLNDIHNAQIVEILNTKFTDGINKEFAISITGIRDAGVTAVLNKVLGIDMPQQIYVHLYCDRVRIGFSDITNTAAPAFVGYVLETRSAGGSRDR